MDYYIEEMRKITWKKMGLDDKIGYFRWIIGHILPNDENAEWVVGRPSVTSHKIEKNMVNFELKPW